jgi:hypothetical protein
MPATTIIEQKPHYVNMPVGQEIIFVVSNDTAVANELKVKFGVEVRVSSSAVPVLGTSEDLIGTFKTTPNNAGVGMFDLRNILENYLKADNMAFNGSAYKLTETSDARPHPLHLIDEFSQNKNSMRYAQFQFFVEYLVGNTTERIDGTTVTSDVLNLSNGYLKYTDELELGLGTSNFGYNASSLFIQSSASSFLTNAPVSQYANVEDYGTFGFWSPNASLSNNIDQIDFKYYKTDGTTDTESITKNEVNGAYDAWSNIPQKDILYFGAFPGNLRGWSTIFQTIVTAGEIEGGYYTVQAYGGGSARSKLYTINVNCPNTKGYESIRLCWLNQWGAWDYYTFTKKSVKTLSTKGTTYTQLGGTWNESTYRVDSYKGGKKSFRVNTTEKIKMNTGFVAEDEAVMFEELINSPEVYLLKGYKPDIVDSALNQYVTPVRVTSKSFTRKTIANDRLMQYSFEVEKTKTLRTQSI